VNRKPKPPPDDPEESARFLEAARAIQADESGTTFARIFKKLVPARKRVRGSKGKS
jgi:hypothetical protein